LSAAWTIQRWLVRRIGMNVTRSCHGVIMLIAQKCCGKLNRNQKINQLFTSAQHLLLPIIGLHVSTDHSVIFRSLICCKFQGAVHTFGIPIVFTLELNPFISVGGYLRHIKDLKMTEWSVETCSPIISSNKCCNDVNNWLIICISTSWCLYTEIRNTTHWTNVNGLHQDKIIYKSFGSSRRSTGPTYDVGLSYLLCISIFPKYTDLASDKLCT
jgi:hypothetical protein